MTVYLETCGMTKIWKNVSYILRKLFLGLQWLIGNSLNRGKQ